MQKDKAAVRGFLDLGVNLGYCRWSPAAAGSALADAQVGATWQEGRGVKRKPGVSIKGHWGAGLTGGTPAT